MNVDQSIFLNFLNSAKLNPLCQFISFAFPPPHYISVQPLLWEGTLKIYCYCSIRFHSRIILKTLIDIHMCERDMMCILYFLCEINWLNIWFVVFQSLLVPYMNRQEQVISRYNRILLRTLHVCDRYRALYKRRWHYSSYSA